MLLERSDVVLMDLRSFQRRNEGCAELARAPNLSRAVVLTDAQTDLAAAKAAAAAAPAGRFCWLEAGQLNRARQREVLQALFAHEAATAGGNAMPLQPDSPAENSRGCRLRGNESEIS